MRLASAAEAERSVDVVVVGAGAAGLCAALSARDAGARVVVLERDAKPAGNTALTLGMLPGAGTRFQREAGIEDSPDLFLADIVKKAKGKTEEALARAVAEASGPAVEWLNDAHGVAFELLSDILYPGHSRHRYHVPKSRTGVEMEEGLLAAARRAGAEIVTSARVEGLEADETGRVVAVRYTDRDGQNVTLGCGALVLATGGYGADPALVKRHIPEMSDAVYCGHDGSDGIALAFGEQLGAGFADLGAYQGHCVAAGPALPVTWALVIRGGFQVNREGRRFSNEMRGYSEQASAVLAEPGGTVFTVYDARCEEPALTFADYHRVMEAGAVLEADDIEGLAAKAGLPAAALKESFLAVSAYGSGESADPFGRDFSGNPPLRPHFKAVEVKGALFHTQGGLAVDTGARVMRAGGTALPNLFAAGGAARGISGPSSDGYLGGNGLVTAVALGRLAGASAAEIASQHKRES
ncbi:fumarate reductase/succinate dehydrogenase flavoprotein [Afifella sp. IM 167]|nr:FAD-dependent oxidoreductase [Afifella sp. IM 167]MBZ8131824.1 fumarate reductase/succinate dehydrogenase flavoprotein [Afifella sp. IM 167]